MFFTMNTKLLAAMAAVALCLADSGNAALQEVPGPAALVFDTSMMGISESDFAPADPFKMASPKALKKSMESLRAYCVVARPMAVELQGGETDARNPITTLIVSFGTMRKQAMKRVHVVSTGDRRMDEAAKQVAEDKQKKLDKEHKYRHLVEDFQDSIAEMRTEFVKGLGKLIVDRMDSAMMSGKDLVTTFKDDVGKDKMMLSASAIGLTSVPASLKDLAVSEESYFKTKSEVMTDAAAVKVDPAELWIREGAAKAAKAEAAAKEALDTKAQAEIAKEKKEAEEAAVVSEVKTEIAFDVALVGVTAAQFSPSAQIAFRESVAENMGMPLETVQISELSNSNEEVLVTKEKKDEWLDTDLVQIGASSLEVKTVVIPPKGITIAAEVQNIGEFLKSSDDTGFASKLQANLKKSGSKMPAPQIKVTSSPKKEEEVSIRTRQPTHDQQPTQRPSHQPTRMSTHNTGPIAKSMKACGNHCRHQGKVLSTGACQAYSETPHCKACMACALPAVKSLCQSSSTENCMLFDKAVEGAARAALAHRTGR